MSSASIPDPSLNGPQSDRGHRGPQFPYMIFIVAVLMFPMVFGCSPKIIEHIQYQHDTTYVSQLQVDSVFRRDSIFIREKNDTVYQYVEHIRDRYRFVHDTTYVHRVDTVKCEQIVEVKVEKALSPWQNFRMVLGTIVIFAIFALAAFVAAKKWLIP